MIHERRKFFGVARIGALGLLKTASAADDRPNVIGPRAGFSPQIGTMVSMLTWMLRTIPPTVQGLTQQQLDHLVDEKANTIGALLLHLAAAETYYQFHTFDGLKWGAWPRAVSEKWDAAMELGDAGRQSIKGHELKFYLDTLKEVREKTLTEFRKRDDAWLMKVDEAWPWGPTNSYCKWFHVCEHISHHGGQIAFLRSRVG